jgi:hypothetical protein
VEIAAVMSPREFELRLAELLAQALRRDADDAAPPLPRYELDALANDLVRAYDELLATSLVVQ